MIILENIKAYIEYLSNRLEGKGFISEEEAVDSAKAALDEWQHFPNSICEQMTPYEAIIKERRKIFAEKKQMVKSLEIKSDFV